MTTTTPIDRAAINRRNAQKSTEHRTPDGKNCSRFNALKHGMTARTLVLPDEDADVLQMRVETWIADLQPQNDVEQYLVEQAVHCSWRLDRAERAEVARLSHLIRSVPIAEANRQQEVVAALGYWLLSDQNVAGNTDLRTDLLNVLVPAHESRTDCRHLDIRDHPEAIVFRLESTAVGCQWLLDRWTELRAVLDQGAPWLWDEKVKALRLLGKRPLDMDPRKWQGYIEDRDEVDDLKLEDLIEEQLDRQLDQRLAAKNPATLAVLRSIADQAIARLETLAAGHRERAEADAAQQAALLSFDASTEGEQLCRHQYSCSRSLFRSLDTLIKVRRFGQGAVSGKRTEESEVKTEEGSVFGVPCSVNLPDNRGNLRDEPTDLLVDYQDPRNEPKAPQVGRGNPQNEPTDPPVDRGNPQDEPTDPLVDHQNRQNEPTAPPVDHGYPQNEPTAPEVAEVSRPRLPFHRAVFLAMILVVLCGAAVRSHRDSQNEPTASPVDNGNRQNEATAAPRRVPGVDADAVGELSGMPPRPIWAQRRPYRLEPSRPIIPAQQNGEDPPVRSRRVKPNVSARQGAGPSEPLESRAGSDGALPSRGERRRSLLEDDHPHRRRLPAPFDGSPIE
jgi:hypothetical protein